MKLHRIPILLAFALSTSPFVLAQGADDCSQAEVIVGPGPHAVSVLNTNPTVPAPPGCPGLGTDDDVWFEWTSPSTGLYGIDTCGGSVVGWTTAIWDTCGGTTLACRQFNCQYEDNRVLFMAVAGTAYKIQVSSPISTAAGSIEINPVDLPSNDDCANATPLQTYGTFAFDLSDSTTDGPIADSCFNAVNDVWFRWTSPYKRPVEFRCSEPGTRLSIMDVCAGIELQCDLVNSFGPAQIFVAPEAGDEFLIRVTATQSTTRPISSIEILPNEIIVNPATQHAYSLIYKEMLFFTAEQYAQEFHYRGNPGNLAALTTQAEHDYVHSQISIPWIGTGFGLYQDLNDPNYSEPGGGWKWTTGEAISFTNWQPPNRPDNFAGNEHFGTLLNQRWEDSENGILRYLVEWAFDSVGNSFCDPAEPNSVGLTTQLYAENAPMAAAGIRLDAGDGPAGEFGYFLVGTASSDPGMMLGQGRLCLSTTGGNVIGRYNANGTSRNSIGLFDEFGVLNNVVGTSSTGTGYDVSLELPTPGGGLIAAGQTWHFQLTHREPGGAFNFSNGISVTF